MQSLLLNRPSRKLVTGFALALSLLVLCIFIRPAGLAANDGLSYFGGFKNTVIIYSLALITYAFFYWKASGVVTNTSKINRSLIKWSLRVFALLLIGLVITPHNLVNTIHTIVGATLFSFELLFSIRLAGDTKSYFDAGLVILEFGGGLVALFYLPKSHGLLLQAQLIFQFAFGLLLIRFLNRS